MTPALNSIHDGAHYFLKTWLDVTKGGPLADPVRDFLFITPPFPVRIHGNGNITSGGAEFEMNFYEDCIVDSHGPEIPVTNNDRASSTLNQMKVYAAPVISGYARDIWPAKIGSQGQTVTAGFNYEFFPRPDTAYLVRFTKVTNGTHWIDIDFWWYESEHLDATRD
jgi:hypothetical protein